MAIIVGSTARGLASRDSEGRPPIHDVPNGSEAEFNFVTETKPGAVVALLSVFEARNVEVDPRNRAALIRNLYEMNITGDALVFAIELVGDHEAFAEKVYAKSPELARVVHQATEAATFAGGQVFAGELVDLAGHSISRSK